MVACLLTTQQRSGPKSYVTKFISMEPFPLDYDVCLNNSDLQNFVEKTITDFGGLRKGKIIGQEISINYKWINKNGWIEINKMLDGLPVDNTVKNERDFAKFIMHNLKGFGPKQIKKFITKFRNYKI